MKKVRMTILSFVAGLLVASCDFLEKEPYKLTPENYFNNETEASNFLTGVYAPLSQSTFYGGDYLYLIGGDDLEHYGGAGRAPQKTGLISNNATTSDPAVTGLWFTLYSGINRANTFLENIDQVPDMNEATRQQYKSEARFLRAYYYFILVQCWGDVPFKTSSTQTVTGLNIPRTDKQQIYDFICTELDQAAGGLKTAGELSYQPGHVSRSVAWGMLARVYLFRAGEHFRDHRAATADETKGYFEQASLYAQKVMGEGHGLAANYWDVFIDLCSDQYNTTAKESIWEVEFAGNGTGDVRGEGRIGNIIGLEGPDFSSKSNITGKADPGYGYAFIYCTPKLFELYQENGDTERMNWNIAPFKYEKDDKTGVVGRNFYPGKLDELKGKDWWNQSYSYGSKDVESTSLKATEYSRVCAKFRREYNNQDVKKHKNYTSINFPVLRYSDVLLMIAEAENEVNSTPNKLAYDCLNAVRERAGISTFKEGELSKDDFRQAVKDERAMELCFEYTRRADLIRWGEYVKNMNELVSRAQSGENWSLGPTNVYTYFMISDTYNYFPIPDSEMSVNKAITENNPGW